MSYPVSNGFSKDSGTSEAEETLRLIASLPAPDGLEDRIHASLRSAPRTVRVLAWPSTLAENWLRAAAAAAIVFVVAGGGWGIYSRVQPGSSSQGVVSPHLGAQGVVSPHLGAQGGFSEGGAVRRPQTLQGPIVANPTNAINKSKTSAKSTEAAATKVKLSDENNTAKPATVPAVQ
jgi:hypothetical protein